MSLTGRLLEAGLDRFRSRVPVFSPTKTMPNIFAKLSRRRSYLWWKAIFPAKSEQVVCFNALYRNRIRLFTNTFWLSIGLRSCLRALGLLSGVCAFIVSPEQIFARPSQSFLFMIGLCCSDRIRFARYLQKYKRRLSKPPYTV